MNKKLKLYSFRLNSDARYSSIFRYEGVDVGFKSKSHEMSNNYIKKDWSKVNVKIGFASLFEKYMAAQTA